MLNRLEQPVKLIFTNRADKAVHAHNSIAMATTCSILYYRIDSFGNIVLKIDGKVPSIRYDAITKTTSEAEVDEITISLRAFVAQLIMARPEVADMYAQVKLAREDKKSGLLLLFIRFMTNNAKYDIESVRHSAGQQFEDGTIARYDGYTHRIVGARFMDSLEVKFQRKSLDEALDAFVF